MSKFELGQVVFTQRISNKMKRDGAFAAFVSKAFERYVDADWGDTCEEDASLNDDALRNGECERIFAVYKYKDRTIWIITERDRSVTTILFPDEY